MKSAVRTTPEADTQTLAAAEWWRANRPKAPGPFEREFHEGVTLLASVPDVGRRYPRRGIPGLRRLLLPRTRYHVYYVHGRSRSEVLVLAVWSAVRGRGPRLARS